MNTLRAPVWHEQYCEVFVEIWETWREAYEFLIWDGQDTTCCPSIVTSVEKYEAHMSLMLLDMLGVWGKKSVIPYLHALYSHVPMQIRRFGSIARFSCSAQELLNARQAVHLLHDVAPGDSCAQTLRAEHRVLHARRWGLTSTPSCKKRSPPPSSPEYAPKPKRLRPLRVAPAKSTRTRRELGFADTVEEIPAQSLLAAVPQIDSATQQRLARAAAAHIAVRSGVLSAALEPRDSRPSSSVEQPSTRVTRSSSSGEPNTLTGLRRHVLFA